MKNTLLILCLIITQFSWGRSEIDSLINQQKYSEALRLVRESLAKNEIKKDEMSFSKLIIQEAMLEIGLHGYETAVKNLKAHPWPKSELPQAMVALTYGQALRSYLQSYSWEIQSREKTVSGEFDLKVLTQDEIFNEASTGFVRAWNVRESLGKYSKKDIPEVITANSYPDEIRGTLRDSLSYLISAYYQDTIGWTPEESNSVQSLNLNKLLLGKEKVDLRDSKIHPLEKVSYVLNDLRHWHEGRGNKGAALEARLELYRVLWRSFSSTEGRETIKEMLKKELVSSEKNPWGAMAFATLAGFSLEEGEEVLARNYALKGSKVFPKSLGAAKCRDLINEIERPLFMIDGMNVDGSQRKSISVKYKNLTKLYLKSYRINYKKPTRPSQRELVELMKGKPDYEWEISLPETTDYRQHKFDVTPPKHQHGLYAIMASSSPHESGVTQGTQIFFSDYIFEVTRDLKRNLLQVEVMKGSDGSLVKDASVSLYLADYKNGHKLLKAQKTDSQGMTSFKVDNSKAYFFVVEKDTEVIGSRNSHSVYNYSETESKLASSFIYTDRSIYRPGQKVLWKVVSYKGSAREGKFEVDSNKEISVELVDLNSQSVQKIKVKTNSFGSAAGEFLIPEGRVLGEWSVRTSNSGLKSLRVEEYKRPSFIVSFDEKQGELRLNKNAVISGSANYYFGMPVNSGKITWTIHRQMLLPWWGSFFRFDWPGFHTKELVSSGTTNIGKDGKFKIQFLPKSDSKNNEINFNYVVKANLTDEGGETQSSEFVAIVGHHGVKVDIGMSKNFLSPETEENFNIKRMDLSGRPVSGKGSWKLIRVETPQETKTPDMIPMTEIKKLNPGRLFFEDDLLPNRWATQYNWRIEVRDWKDAGVIASGDLTHSENGLGTIKIPKLKEGIYRLRYGDIEQKEFLVLGKNTHLPFSGLLLVEKETALPGEKIKIFASSGFKNQRLSLSAFKSGKKLWTKEFKERAILDVPVSEEDRGGVSFSLSVIRDYQKIDESVNVNIPWSNKLVDMKFISMRDKIRPGAKEKWKIQISKKNPKDEFELLSYMYDKSLDVFSLHSPSDILSIYPNKYGVEVSESQFGEGTKIYTQRSSFPYKSEFKYLSNDELKFYPRYGIGGPGRRLGFGSGGVVAEFAASAAPGKVAMMKSAPSADKTVATEGSKTELRSNFAETAFWYPSVVVNKDGVAEIEFTVPDSLTTWNVWAMAFSRDLKSGQVSRQIRSSKDLMVRPYLPRFLREGDEAEIKVVVNNSSEKNISGKLQIDVLDEAESKSIAEDFRLSQRDLPFMVEAGKSSNISFKIKVPVGIKNSVFKVVANSNEASDGEVKVLPILPGRMHLSESKFVTLKNKDSEKIDFEKMRENKDPTRVQDLFMVTVDAQLFYSVLSSLPYLTEFPYQSTDQMMNSFVSSGIISSVFDDYPELAKVSKDFSKRKTRTENVMGLEESPWMISDDSEVVSILDQDIARNARRKNLNLLKESQTQAGGFPWFSGGAPSPWMTTYILYGFSKAIEFKVDVPKEMIQKAWGYLHEYYVSEVVRELIAKDKGHEVVTFLNYVLSSYPDSSWTGELFTQKDRERMLNFSFKHWKNHSPYLKAYLALTLKRAQRTEDAKLVWDSVMDSAKTNKEEGTFWAREDRSWLWYNDTIETHALALRVGSELGVSEEKLEGMVQWLFLNKKLNHWKSTRATSEVIYTLSHYLKKTKQLGIKESVQVKLAGKTTQFDFSPSKYTGKNKQIVLKGDEVNEKTTPVEISKVTPGIAFVSATWQYSTEELPKAPVGDFISVSRKFYKRVLENNSFRLIPISDGETVSIGDEIEVQLSIKTKHEMEYVHLRDPRASGFEPTEMISQHKRNLGIFWYEEVRDNGMNFFFEKLPYGQFTFKYRVRATTAGVFKTVPAQIQSLYAPEFVGHSDGMRIKVNK